MFCIADSLSAMIACFQKNMQQELKEVCLERDYLEYHGECSLVLCYCMESFMQVCFF